MPRAEIVSVAELLEADAHMHLLVADRDGAVPELLAEADPRNCRLHFATWSKDSPDPRDLCGRRKLLGEVAAGRALSQRTVLLSRSLDTPRARMR